MKLNTCLFLALLCCTGLASAQETYDTAGIPAELLTKSTAVVRMEEQNFTVKNTHNATYNYKIAITVLNKNGDGFSYMSEYYDKFSSIYNLKAVMYDAKGIKIRSYKSSDFKDESITSEGTMYDDNRRKGLVFLNATYPYTIEYSYSKDYNGYLSFPSWEPIEAYDLAIEKSSYTLEIPKSINFRYLKSEQLKTDSTVTDTKTTYKWACQKLPAFEHEPMSVGLKNLVPWVTASPNEFEYDNSKGNVENWKNLGSWVYQLSNSGQILPENTKAIVKTLIASAKTDKEKIAILYQYLQSNTRYVGVQLGIGGFKPITAEKVAAVNYGDCKALSNYMKALLSEAGIASHLVIIGSGLPSLKTKYASFGQANHMILCVPAAKDTTWLECTSQHTPVGYIGDDNAARTVLLVTEEGGKLVNTPVYTPEANLQSRKTTVLLAPDRSAAIHIKTSYCNAQYEGMLRMLLIEPVEQRKKLMNNLGIPNMEISSASFLQPDKTSPKIEEDIVLNSSQMLTQGGDKLFLTLNLLNRRESVPAKVENRKTSFSVPYGYRDTDEIIYTLPEGYKAEFVPQDILLESEFGKYTAKAVLKDNTIVYTRNQQMNSKKYTPEKYKDLVDFYKKIYLADKQKVVLAKVN
ncbi:DUF3857 domain-containing protein [Pedobacter cryoconitis]|uniref:Transglutaminase-like putative cysteine protease n=1 Tax=Pedobacter cryoconitis TaxID=188932 RepID=A0A7X0J681_9SPHI|nr:DUF3857 domain-containing protein [Pedobacter cryoconitis]MBB6501850.1 transglutaminase-like putative cysteine protease [Pedobacter cryoconitis]